jgi:LysR family transcriptional regulator, transcriptional activator for dmlA
MSTSLANLSEFTFFAAVARCASLSAAARELGLTPSAVSKRVAQMEARLKVHLMTRTTRRVGLTREGEIYLSHARSILAELDLMQREMAAGAAAPVGLVRVVATPGFGRSYIAPLASRFTRKHPHVQVQLDLAPSLPRLSEDHFDVAVRFGEAPEARVVARLLARNRRILVASPSYLARAGTPRVPQDLLQHDCLVLRQEGSAFGRWAFGSARQKDAVRVTGSLSTNDGEIAVAWALDGHGILLRAEWDVARYLRSGRLVQVLKSHAAPPADIYAVYPARHRSLVRVTAFVDFLVSSFQAMTPGEAVARTEW